MQLQHHGSRLNRTFILLLIGLMTGIFYSAQPLHAQEKSVVWERFDVDITVQEDGSFDVTEGQAIQFTKGEFTFGTRYITIQNFESLDNWSLTDGQGNVYVQNSSGDPYTFSVDESSKLARGADELDIVNSGLEETMAFAYRQIHRCCEDRDHTVDLRTGAMILAIEKVVVAYEELGIFP